jgi:phosphoribosylaminoimidazole-succinocarboxamide synthase
MKVFFKKLHIKFKGMPRRKKIKISRLVFEGRNKKFYTSEEENCLILEFKDSSMLNNGRMFRLKGRGELRNKISSILFEYLQNFNVLTHYIKPISDTSMLVRKLEMIPIKVVVRNIAAGNFCDRFGIERGKLLDQPVIELYYKNNTMHYPFVNDYHIYALHISTPEEIAMMTRIASKINAILRSFFERRNLKFVDARFEFGKLGDDIVLGDEISPETCRIWDSETNESLDFDRVRFNLGKVRESYMEVLRKISI